MCVGGGGGLSSNSVCIAKGLNYKAYTLQRYSDKKSPILIQREGYAWLYVPVHEIGLIAYTNRLFWRAQRN